MIISVFTLVLISTTQMTFKCSPSAQSPPAKRSGKFPPRRLSSSTEDFANSLDGVDATGDKIQQELADIALKRWGRKLSSDKIKSFSDKYKQPQNRLF